ncbi:uncharacterized protein N0V89_002063 [Didymosphaeria variabile]|uniref:Uncharacterized protein n=1 Tax=Didymosphaeria variabile TaxID=1932322 RepID=A0A9W9CE07_9PLEO|nr:uncharacterized protein N0V89_002063 [Didymosphaeria variabile]KAJ4357487.1 hypothetical protein N0V89_002063 [Didymosphaeria variabile]
MSIDANQSEAARTVASTTATNLAVDKQTEGGASRDGSTPPVKPSVLDSSFPVLLPYDDALFMDQNGFDALVKELVGRREAPPLKRPAEVEIRQEPAKKAAFIEGLEKHSAHARTAQELAAENKTLTANSDVTHISSQNPLVDLFYDLGQNTPSIHLDSLLDAAWSNDPLTTLKIVFNARSIHLGKSNKVAAYKALGWLATNHPHTLLTNLVWLVRPVIEKKVPGDNSEKEVKKAKGDNQDEPSLVILGGPNKDSKDETEDFDIIDAEEAAPINETTAKAEIAPAFTNETEALDLLKAHDVRFGVSHGYYKDLLNMLVLAANDQLTIAGDPSALLTQKQDRSKGWRKRAQWDAAQAKANRRVWRKQQYERVTEKLQTEPFYRALHLTVARIFAQQLQEDRKVLDSDDKSHLKNLSLAAKWAPSFGEFHDKHTFILSSIAEILAPRMTDFDSKGSDSARETYLRHAREHFRRQYSSPLRKALAVVERDIAAQTFSNIKYDRVPSLAMERYSELFAKKDQEHFFDYVKKVAMGKAKISGATLLPSKLVAKARNLLTHADPPTTAAAIKAHAQEQVVREVIDGQWKTLVQRVKDSGALSSSIAVCDVSGSMTFPQLDDKTTPLDSAIGLSLLVSEVTAPPFGGGFITFSETPTYVSVGGPRDTRGLVDKVRYIKNSTWSMNTNFVAVFEDVILPMAIRNNLTQEDMVKQVFVFSDMQFDAAQSDSERWTTSYEYIKKRYTEAGYEVPKLVFWNLADRSSVKPVTMEDMNTALVSGYSQGMLKVFLEGGNFEDEIEVVEEDRDDGVVEVRKEKKEGQLALVKKAVSHPSYGMLKVAD